MTRILGHNYIGGQRSAQGNIQLESLDATTGEPLPGLFSQATEMEVDAAAKAAAAAFPAYRSLPAWKRADFTEAIADELDALGKTSSPRCAAKQRCPTVASWVSVVVPACKCACSPRSCAVATSMAPASTVR